LTSRSTHFDFNVDLTVDHADIDLNVDLPTSTPSDRKVDLPLTSGSTSRSEVDLPTDHELLSLSTREVRRDR
jgi:hypothetical protein